MRQSSYINVKRRLCAVLLKEVSSALIAVKYARPILHNSPERVRVLVCYFSTNYLGFFNCLV